MVSWLDLAMLLLAWTVLVAGVFFWWLWRHRSTHALDENRFDQMQAQIIRLQKDLHSLSARAPQVLVEPPRIAEPLKRRSDLPPSSELSSPYNQAIELARHGLSAGEVAERCGISRSEAELIVSLYRNSSTS